MPPQQMVTCSVALNTAPLEAALRELTERVGGLEEAQRQREESEQEKLFKLVTSLSDRLTQLESRILRTKKVNEDGTVDEASGEGPGFAERQGRPVAGGKGTGNRRQGTAN